MLILEHVNSLYEPNNPATKQTNKQTKAFPNLFSVLIPYFSSFSTLLDFIFFMFFVVYAGTFTKGSIFLSPPSQHFILCRCRKYIPCYQPQFMYVLKIKVKSIPLSLKIPPSACANPSPAVLSVPVHWKKKKKKCPLQYFSSADYHTLGTILTTHFRARALKSLDLVSSLPIALSCINQVGSA